MSKFEQYLDILTETIKYKKGDIIYFLQYQEGSKKPKKIKGEITKVRKNVCSVKISDQLSTLVSYKDIIEGDTNE